MSKILAASRFKAQCLGLLDEVAATGESLVITKRGRPVALLTPPAVDQMTDLKQVVAEIRQTRKGRKLGRISLRTLVEEGRRY